MISETGGNFTNFITVQERNNALDALVNPLRRIVLRAEDTYDEDYGNTYRVNDLSDESWVGIALLNKTVTQPTGREGDDCGFITISRMNIFKQKQGYGKATCLEIFKQTPKNWEVRSDQMLSVGSVRLWRSLVRDGVATAIKDTEIPDFKTTWSGSYTIDCQFATNFWSPDSAA